MLSVVKKEPNNCVPLTSVLSVRLMRRTFIVDVRFTLMRDKAHFLNLHHIHTHTHTRQIPNAWGPPKNEIAKLCYQYFNNFNKILRSSLWACGMRVFCVYTCIQIFRLSQRIKSTKSHICLTSISKFVCFFHMTHTVSYRIFPKKKWSQCFWIWVSRKTRFEKALRHVYISFLSLSSTSTQHPSRSLAILFSQLFCP